MVSKGLKKKILEELEKAGSILSACSKFGVHRSTYYRMKERDEEFRKNAEEAEELGRENKVDMGEYRLLQNVNAGNQRAIEYLLGHNSERYRNMRQEDIQKIVESTIEKSKEQYYNSGYIDAFKEFGEALRNDTLVKTESDKKEIILDQSVPDNGTPSNENIPHLS